MTAANERLRLVKDAAAETPELQPTAVDPDESPSRGDVGSPPGEAGRQIVPHLASLHACARALVGDPHLADDIVHETVAQALAGWRRYDPTRELGAWLRGIAVHLARHHWRKLRHGRSATTVLADAARESPSWGSDPESELSGREQAARLLRALDALTPNLREAFVLRVIEELPTEEVARLTRTSTAAIHTRVCKARAILSAAIDAERARGGKRRSDDGDG